MIETEVIIAVEGGVVSLVSKTQNMVVKVRDYDIQNLNDITGEDENGEYQEYEL